jgi:hypothetical protein
MKKKVWYVEPADYFPKELRKKYKLGEYSEMNITHDNAQKETELSQPTVQ